MMQTTLFKDGRKYEATLTSTHFSYRTIKRSCSHQENVEVSLNRIFAIKEQRLNNQKNDQSKLFTLHFAKEVDTTNLKVEKVTFKGDGPTCEIIVGRIQSALSETKRPRQLLVIINPNSGRKTAKKIFRKNVEPFFKLCGISCKVIVTKRPKEAQEILQTHDLTNVDGVVTVGGDGLYCETLNGLVTRAQRDAGADYNNPDAKVVPSTVPIGIIPAGSGDYVVQYLHGTRDVMTAAIYIALGKTAPVNAASVHQDGQLSVYSGLLLGFGLFGDIMNDCDKFRWMGATRFSIIPIATLLRRRMFDVEVEYLPDGAGEWQKTEGKLYGVDTYVITRKPKETKMMPCFGDSALTLYLTSKCSLTSHVQHLTKVQDHKADCFDYDFVEQHRVQGYRVRFPRSPLATNEAGETSLAEKYFLNCDGEVINISNSEFEVRLHKQVVPLFGNVGE